MRQILLNSQGALVARMPRPAITKGEVLVRTHFSLISTGTELASLRPSLATDETPTPSVPRLAATYLGKAILDPHKAARRLVGIARRTLEKARPTQAATKHRVAVTQNLVWSQAAAVEFVARDSGFRLRTDDSEYGHQAISSPISVTSGLTPFIEIKGNVESGAVSIGVLDGTKTRWLFNRNFGQGSIHDDLIFDPVDSTEIVLVVSNAGIKRQAMLNITAINVVMVAPEANGLPYSELDDQGWNVGYSLAGEIVALGAGITDLAVGDMVACAGAGKANHADYVSVPRNLVCRVPQGCDLQLAATTTVGTIALQGVRRAAPMLGETVCVIGLGLIGQITAQLLHANGVKVLGLDLDPQRVAKALALGMDAGASTAQDYQFLVRDLTGGRGADRVLITAAAKSDALINLAMDVARSKGRVIIVGDVGLNVKRDIFYRKEIDLLISTSYGPGRYDRGYEEEGKDYPFAHVRWTLNRNMQAYLELIADKRVDVAALIERIIPVAEAAKAYRELADSDAADMPLGVLLHYPDDSRILPHAPNSTRIEVRGHRKPKGNVIRYALLGAGAFGTAMLVPQMAKRKDLFFLKGIVSRNTTVAGNFARQNQIEVLSTELDDVLKDPAFDLIVIATRHYEHADQVVRCLQSGKHVFVEKPLALNWEELDRLAACYEALSEKPLLMVGFNRRFSPAVQALRSALESRRSPLIMNYRLNGGYIALDSWVQGTQGGGRNIGEACHMYDVFRSLSGAPAVSVHAEAIDPSDLPYLRNDNFCATIRYADGSLGNLVYTALGPKTGLPKERLEVFCDGEAYVLDDYRSLVRARDTQVLWQNDQADKGHFEELSRFGKAVIDGNNSPIPFEELMETSSLALHIEDLLQGKAIKSVI
jgi:predicted dehydrogenase/NADPH:quinone reductase-like Zn-dependent oxidoreductase